MNLKKIIGLRNIVTNKGQWKYLLFYDIDEPTEADIKNLIEYMDSLKFVSYIIYSTKAGIHLIGLTPLTATMWGIIFGKLQWQFPEYYSGQTIRLSRKEGEKQELIYSNFEYPFLINLVHLYRKRFNMDFKEENMIAERWSLVFEKYWSQKI